jgi:hypothetical protein
LVYRSSTPVKIELYHSFVLIFNLKAGAFIERAEIVVSSYQCGSLAPKIFAFILHQVFQEESVSVPKVFQRPARKFCFDREPGTWHFTTLCSRLADEDLPVTGCNAKK